MTREHAKNLRSIIEKQSANLADDVALEYDGTLYRCLTAHLAQETWAPGGHAIHVACFSFKKVV